MRSIRSNAPKLRLIRGGKSDSPTSADFARAAAFTALLFVPGVMYCVYLEWHSRRFGVDSILSKDFSEVLSLFKGKQAMKT